MESFNGRSRSKGWILKSRWVAPELRDDIVEDIERLCLLTGISLNSCLKTLGIRKPRFYDWKERKGLENKHNGMIPKDTWILESERQAIINYFEKNPLNGCRRLSFMMVDEDVAYVSANTVHRVLKAAGLIGSQSQKPSSKGKGFDQPSKPHAQWHIDISYINAGGTFYYLCSILDGYSRFIIEWDIAESMKEEDIELVVKRAKERYPDARIRLISDNGPQFKAREFKSFLRMCGMDQTFTSPYYPQSNGKIERWHKELKQSRIRPKAPRDLAEARKYVGDFVESCNYSRLHSAIGYVTPYDKLLGIDAELKQERAIKLENARISRKQAWQTIDREQFQLAISG
ncbi:MAG: transposase [Oligoflexus sp.]